MKREKGFTLLEVMISLLILAIVLLGVTALATTSVKVNSNANHLTWAYQTAQADLETLRRLSLGIHFQRIENHNVQRSSLHKHLDCCHYREHKECFRKRGLE